MLLFVVYYNHKVRERATSKPTLRDVGNLHEPYKSPPFRQRLTALLCLEFVKLLTTTPPGVSLAPRACVRGKYPRLRACRFGVRLWENKCSFNLKSISFDFLANICSM